MHLFILGENMIEGYKLVADCHTHTTFSHGKGSVLDNAKAAKEIGLETLAISDHGLNHIAFGLKRRELAEYKNEIQTAREETGIKVLVGIESNIIGYDGTIDIRQNELEHFDWIVMGYHRAVWAKSFKEFFTLIIKNFFGNTLKVSQKQIEKNTMAYINAVNKYKINVISHMNYLMKVDCKRVAEACAKVGTLIELNGKKIDFTDKDIQDMLETDVKFIVDSDAHSPERVGDVSVGMEFALKHNIPLDRIVNIKKI